MIQQKPTKKCSPMVNAQVYEAGNPGFKSRSGLFPPFLSSSFLSFYPSILSSLNPFFFPSPFFIPSFPYISPLFMLTLIIVTMQTNYTKTKFQTVCNLLFSITPCLSKQYDLSEKSMGMLHVYMQTVFI